MLGVAELDSVTFVDTSELNNYISSGSQRWSWTHSKWYTSIAHLQRKQQKAKWILKIQET